MPNTYLPKSVLTPLYTFIQLAADDEAADFQGKLATAFPDVDIQVFADGITDGNMLVIVLGEDPLSVAPLSYVGYNQGQWAMRTAAKLATEYTAYTPS